MLVPLVNGNKYVELINCQLVSRRENVCSLHVFTQTLPNNNERQITRHAPLIHLSIYIYLLLIRWQVAGRQAQEVIPDVTLPSEAFQVFLGNPEASAGQTGCEISSACTGSAPGPPLCWMFFSRRHPGDTPKLRRIM